MNRCCSFLLLSAPHSLFSIWTDLKRSEKIPEAPTWWWEWIWLSRPSGLYQNSPDETDFYPCGEFWSPEGPVSQIHSLHLHVGAPRDLVRFFKVCSDAKERVGCRKQQEATAPIQSLVKLQPWFLSLRWKTFLWAELQPGFLCLQWRTCPWAEYLWGWWRVKYQFHQGFWPDQRSGIPITIRPWYNLDVDLRFY